jgi:molybdate transport system regulatory protein
LDSVAAVAFVPAKAAFDLPDWRRVREPVVIGPCFREHRCQGQGSVAMTALKLRILFDGAMIGPGKAQLLGGIRETGSIAAAGRQMQMSYKRAWSLVEEMNSAFAEPLVASARGGPGGGGAVLTEAGVKVLGLYREIMQRAERAAAEPVAALEAMLRPRSEGELSVGK